MASYAARLHIPGQSKLPLNIEVDVSDETMTLLVGDQEVASWPLGGLEVGLRSDGFHVKTEDEEFVLNVTDATRFAVELGVGNVDREAPMRNARTTSVPLLNATTLNEFRFEDVERRIERVGEALSADGVSPAEAFAQWLKLLKEINRRHGQGSIPTHHYFELNTRLLELMPEPEPPPA